MPATTLFSANLPHNAFAALSFASWSRNIAIPAVDPGVTNSVFLAVVSAWCGFAPFVPPSFPQVTVGGVVQSGLIASRSVGSPDGGSGNADMLLIGNWDPTQTGNVNVSGEESFSETTGLILVAMIGTNAQILSIGTGLLASTATTATATTPTVTDLTAISIAITGNLGLKTLTGEPLLTAPGWITSSSAYKPPWPGFFQTEPSIGTAIAFHDGLLNFPTAATWDNQAPAGWGASISQIVSQAVNIARPFAAIL